MEQTFDSITDARTYVMNSGVLDWDWGVDAPKDISDKLAEHLFRGHFSSFNDCLKSFIKTVLKQSPSEYGLR